MNPMPRILEVRKHILKHNDEIARSLRNRFQEAGVFVVNLVSSPGSGKTAFLESTLTKMRSDFRVAALVGDLATENDANRLARSQVPVRQIITGTVCHLEAAMIERSLEDWNLRELDFLFIENVGNLVCPSSYDLGENLRVVLLSVTEGEDKPLKYPSIVFPVQWNSTVRPLSRTCRLCAPASRSCGCRRKPEAAWMAGSSSSRLDGETW
jgi:hydrogenase nickel incorporation protein HypB